MTTNQNDLNAQNAIKTTETEKGVSDQKKEEISIEKAEEKAKSVVIMPEKGKENDEPKHPHEIHIPEASDKSGKSL